jgi:hypothetical protein
VNCTNLVERSAWWTGIGNFLGVPDEKAPPFKLYDDRFILIDEDRVLVHTRGKGQTGSDTLRLLLPGRVYSQGTDTPLGSSLSAYLQKHANYRASTIFIPSSADEIKTMVSSLKSMPSKIHNVLARPEKAYDSCAARTNEALRRGIQRPEAQFTRTLVQRHERAGESVHRADGRHA